MFTFEKISTLRYHEMISIDFTIAPHKVLTNIIKCCCDITSHCFRTHSNRFLYTCHEISLCHPENYLLYIIYKNTFWIEVCNTTKQTLVKTDTLVCRPPRRPRHGTRLNRRSELCTKRWSVRSCSPRRTSRWRNSCSRARVTHSKLSRAPGNGIPDSPSSGSALCALRNAAPSWVLRTTSRSGSFWIG